MFIAIFLSVTLGCEGHDKTDLQVERERVRNVTAAQLGAEQKRVLEKRFADDPFAYSQTGIAGHCAD